MNHKNSKAAVATENGKTYAHNLHVRRLLNKQWRNGHGSGNVSGFPIPGVKSDAYYDRVNRRIDKRNAKRTYHNKQVELSGKGQILDMLPKVQNPRTYVPPVELAAPKPKRVRKPKTVKIILGDK